jgi:hypothetical protein
LGICLLAAGFVFTGCSSKQHDEPASAAATTGSALQPVLHDEYMPDWTDTKFEEAELCGYQWLPNGRRYRDAVADAKRGDRKALEEVISCGYSPRCDAAATELHGGVIEHLLLAVGDIQFSKALAAEKARHGGKSPFLFLQSETTIRDFFPLTAEVQYGPGKKKN